LSALAPTVRSFGLDAMRVCAALMVVCVHACIFFYHLWPQLPVVFFFAGLGVDLFFVLSGYLVGGLLIDAARRDRPWVMHFWMRRWWRTLPSFYLFLLINLLLLRWTQGVWANPLAHLIFVQNLAWEHPDFFPEAWSLSIEELFYLCAPLAFVAFGMTSAKLRKVFAFAIALIVAGIIFRWLWVLQFDPTWDSGVKKLAVLRVDAIAFGLAAVAAMRLWPSWCQAHRQGLAVAGAFVIVMSAWLTYASEIDSSMPARVFVFTLNGLGCALLLPWLTALPTDRNRWSVRSIAALARWSYALYLVHMPIMRIGLALLPPVKNFGMAWLYAICFVVMSVAAAALVYRVFERRVLHWRDRLLPAHA